MSFKLLEIGRTALVAAAICVATAPSSVAMTIEGDHVFAASETLSEDVTVTGTATFASGVTVDVAGHRLTVHGIAGPGTVTSSAAGGVLDLCIADTCVLDSTTITGGANMQVWKTGAGFLHMMKVNTGFGTGGSQTSLGPVAFVVKAGRVKKGNDTGNDSPNGGDAMYCGAAYSTIKVEAGAQFDIAGRTAWDYNYDIAGDGPEGAPVKGALISSVQPSPNPWHWHNNHGYLYDITLSADASIGGAGMWALHWYNNGTCYTYMNGHRLTFACGHIYVGQNRHFDWGELYVAPGATCNAYNGVNANAAGMTFRIDGEYRTEAYGISPLKSFLFGATGVLNADADPSKLQTTVVHDTYAPNLNAKSTSKIPHPKVQLGAAGHTATTLDLRLFSAPFDATGTLSFFAGSTVSVDVSGRADIHALSRSKDAVTGKRNGYLMTWDAATWTAVSQADTKVKFELCGEAKARYRLIADASGLLIAPPAGFIVIVR